MEPKELTHISPEEQKKKTVKITVDELINIWNESTELEKLKDKNTALEQYADISDAKVDEVKSKLTEAKEIIQELVHEISVLYIATDKIVVSPTVKQAERFISEVEK